MKTSILRVFFAVVICASLSNCTTAYDAYGRPQQVVTPGGAALGMAAAGVLAYSLANNNNNRNYRHYRGGSYYRGAPYGGSYYRNASYGRPYYGRGTYYGGSPHHRHF